MAKTKTDARKAVKTPPSLAPEPVATKHKKPKAKPETSRAEREKIALDKMEVAQGRLARARKRLTVLTTLYDDYAPSSLHRDSFTPLEPLIAHATKKVAARQEAYNRARKPFTHGKYASGSVPTSLLVTSAKTK